MNNLKLGKVQYIMVTMLIEVIGESFLVLKSDAYIELLTFLADVYIA